MGKQIKVTLLRSGINRKQGQKDTLRGLGLTRLHKTVYLENTASNRGMIRKVQHMVEVAMATEEERAEAGKAPQQPSYRIVEAS
ncbi:MAG: 50S ribosomal protein L30 [Deltaproteobacteria bacterium]|nr:50S ribosomal protein L30 [Deltaproteobacteria bacterium]